MRTEGQTSFDGAWKSLLSERRGQSHLPPEDFVLSGQRDGRSHSRDRGYQGCSHTLSDSVRLIRPDYAVASAHTPA